MACISIKPHFTSVLPSTLPPWCCFLLLYLLLSRIDYPPSSHCSSSYPLDVCNAFRLTLPHTSLPDGLWHILCSPVLLMHISGCPFSLLTSSVIWLASLPSLLQLFMSSGILWMISTQPKCLLTLFYSTSLHQFSFIASTFSCTVLCTAQLVISVFA